MTWEWSFGLRGYLHPLVFAILYQIMRILHIDNAELLIVLPRILQSICSFVTDYYTWRLAKKWFKQESIALNALFCSVVNWFVFYCGVRTFSNSMETMITTIGIWYFDDGSMMWVFFAGLGCVMRPTNALIWVPLMVYASLKSLKKRDFAFFGKVIALMYVYCSGIDWE